MSHKSADKVTMDRASLLALADLIEDAGRSATLDSDPKFWAGFDAALQMVRDVGSRS